MHYLNFKKNPYFSIVVKNHAKELNINDKKFEDSLMLYLVEYVSSHWSIMADYLLEPQIGKIDNYNKSYSDFEFTKSYLWNCFSAVFTSRYESEISKLEKFLNVEDVDFTMMKDYYINEMGDKIPRKDPIQILNEDAGLQKESALILYLLSYDKKFIKKLKNAYIYSKSKNDQS